MSEYVKAKLDTIRYYIRMSRDTDYIMPLWLPFLPAILAIISFVIWFIIIVASMRLGYTGGPMGPIRPHIIPAAFITGFGTLGVIIIVAAIINIYVLYKWISRRNDHFKRTRRLYREVLELFNVLSKDRKPAKMASLETLIKEMEVEETEKSAIVWIVLVLIIGFLIFYIYHFLNRDFYKHERREAMIAENITGILNELGATRVPRKIAFETIPKRNTVLYIVLSLLTLGIFGLYWIYTITKDPNEHFKLHKVWEEDLAYCLETLATGKSRESAL